MKIFCGLTAPFLVVLLAACGGPGPVATETSLREIAGASLAAVGDERWDDVYGFLHPIVQARCSHERYFANNVPGITPLKSLFGVQDHERLEYRIANVYIDGAQGVVESQIFFNSQPLSWKDSSGNSTEEWFTEEWIFVDGAWWPDTSAAGAECAGPGKVALSAVAPV